MDPLFRAISQYRRHNFEKCVEICTLILDEKPYDEAAWTLKIKALTQQVYVDDLETDEEGIADILMDENAIAQMAKPGTSLKTPNTRKGTSQAYRPVTQSGRPLSGVVRPGTQSGRPGTMEQAIRTRTAYTARPITSSSGRFVRLGTASMLSQPDGPFINFARLNISKYASKPNIAKHLFEYAYFHDNDIRQALDIAAQATQACQYEDWWWKFQLGKCYYRFGMFRDAEKQFKSSIRQQEMIDSYLWMGKVYIGLDQPLAALDMYKQGLEKFPEETYLMVHIARIYEGLNDLDVAVKYYRDVLSYEAIDVEAIACIAAHHFYSDQPEVALRYYRRLLQMGVCNSELYNNLALCCFYSQQHDMAVMCFERALALATDESLSDVWYNIGHLALGIGDKNLATQCLRLALVANNDHAESYNNLGVIEGTKGNLDQGETIFRMYSSQKKKVSTPPKISPNCRREMKLVPIFMDLSKIKLYVKKICLGGRLHIENCINFKIFNMAKAFFAAASNLAQHLFEPHFNQALLAEKTGDLQSAYHMVQKSLEAYPEHADSKELFQRIKKLFTSL